MKRDCTAEEVEREHTEYGEETLPPPPSLSSCCMCQFLMSLCLTSHTQSKYTGTSSLSLSCKPERGEKVGREKETELKQGGEGIGKRTPLGAVTATLMNGEKLCDSYIVYYTLCVLLYMYVCIVLLVIASKLCVHASVCICICV